MRALHVRCEGVYPKRYNSVQFPPTKFPFYYVEVFLHDLYTVRFSVVSAGTFLNASLLG